MWCRRLRILCCHCYGFVAAVVQVWSLTWECPHAMGTAKKKKKKNLNSFWLTLKLLLSYKIFTCLNLTILFLETKKRKWFKEFPAFLPVLCSPSEILMFPNQVVSNRLSFARGWAPNICCWTITTARETTVNLPQK